MSIIILDSDEYENIKSMIMNHIHSYTESPIKYELSIFVQDLHIIIGR